MNMDRIRECVTEYWKKVEDFYKSITPNMECVSKIENQLHVPAHYLMMALSLVLGLVVFSITRRVFANLVVIVPMAIVCMKDLHENKNEKKWMYYWMLFSFLTVYNNVLSHIFYFPLIKVAICYYFAFFDKECYLEKGMNYVWEGLCTAMEKLKTTCNVKVE